MKREDCTVSEGRVESPFHLGGGKKREPSFPRRTLINSIFRKGRLQVGKGDGAVNRL